MVSASNIPNNSVKSPIIKLCCLLFSVTSIGVAVGIVIGIVVSCVFVIIVVLIYRCRPNNGFVVCSATDNILLSYQTLHKIMTFTGWMLLNRFSSEWLQHCIPVSARHGSSVPGWTVSAHHCPFSKWSWWASVRHNQQPGHTTLQTVNLRHPCL